MKFTGFSGWFRNKKYLYILAKGLQKQQGHLLLFPFTVAISSTAKKQVIILF